MLKLLLITLIFTQVSFGQVKSDDYEIYSLILEELLNSNNDGNKESVLIIERFVNRFKLSDYELFDYETDSVTSSDISFLYANGVEKSFIQKLQKDLTLKTAIKELTSDFENQPIIQADLLESDNLSFETIGFEKYESFFRKRGWKSNSWKRIERKYGVEKVIELSKVNYEGNFATTYFGLHCGGLCGNGFFIILERINGEWSTIARINLWES